MTQPQHRRRHPHPKPPRQRRRRQRPPSKRSQTRRPSSRPGGDRDADGGDGTRRLFAVFRPSPRGGARSDEFDAAVGGQVSTYQPAGSVPWTLREISIEPMPPAPDPLDQLIRHLRCPRCADQLHSRFRAASSSRAGRPAKHHAPRPQVARGCRRRTQSGGRRRRATAVAQARPQAEGQLRRGGA